MYSRTLLLFFITSLCEAQSPQAEINQQVWKPFILSFDNHDTNGFMAVHSTDAVRSPRDGKVVWNWEEYKNQQARGDQQDQLANRKRTLELRFSERIASQDLAVEVGVYKTTYYPANGKTQSFFGRFHVVLRKESGIWKILVDTDSSEGGTIGEKEFLAAQPLEL